MDGNTTPATEPTTPDFESWEYDGPPTLFDLVENNWLTNTIRLLLHVLARAYLRLFHRLKVRGDRSYSRSGPCVIAANHASHFDVIAILSAFPLARINAIRSLAAKDYFFTSAPLRLVAFLIANTIPFDRKRVDRRSLSCCQRALYESGCILIFPEGTRSLDGRLLEFNAGIGILAKRFGVPILPAYITGAHDALAKGRLLPRLKPISVRFGGMVDYSHVKNGKSGWLWIAKDLRERIVALSR